MASAEWLVNLNVADMAKNNLLQCAVWEPEDEKWYLAQAQNAGPRDMEHTYIRRFNWQGKYEGYCKLKLWGHGNQIGVRKSAAGNTWIWVPMDSYNSRGTTTRTRASRVIWEKGREYDRKESGNVDIFDAKWSNQGFSLGLHYPIMFSRRGYGSYEEYTKVNEEDFRAERGRPLDKIRVPKSGRGRYFQGCTADLEYLYVLSGSTDHNQYIDIFSWSTNKKVKRLTFSASYLKKQLKGHATYSSVEAEGLYVIQGELYMGTRSGPAGSKRDFSIFYIDW